MEKCIKCTEPKPTCNVLGLLSLPSAQLVPLCKKRKQFLGWTVQIVADKSNVPVGTVGRFFSGELSDFRYDTVRHIVCVLWDVREIECHDTAVSESELESEVKQLRARVRYQEAAIAHQEEQIKRLNEQIDRKDDYIDRLAKKAGI